MTSKLNFSENETRDWFKNLLKESNVEVVFTKTDGTERTMLCTLNENNIPAFNIDQTASTKKRQESQGVLRVWDIDKESWRSFRWDSIKRIQFNLGI